MIPAYSYQPDKGVYSADSTTVIMNVMPLVNGFGPMATLTEIGDALASQCFGAWWYRSTTGSFGFIATTQTGIFRRQSNGTWDDVSRTVGGAYTGPGTGEMWQAERFGAGLYLTNINDELQVIDVDTGTDFADVAGSPPQAKYLETVGDFLFLAYLKVGATEFPEDWQHSDINDATGWTVTGTPGDSDRQMIPDGDEIVAIMAMPGGARIIQRRAKRRLMFTPGSALSFQMADIDSSRGAVAPLAVVPIGGDSYFYINETGFYINDTHQSIGQDQVDHMFLADVDLSKLGEVQGISDPAEQMVWIRYQDQSGTYKMLGWHWLYNKWVPCNVAAKVLVSAVAIGAVLDDLDAYGELDDIEIPLDSRVWKGGRITFGAFTATNKLALFAGAAAEAVIETATTELSPETGTFVYGAKAKGDVTDYTIQVGTADLMDDGLVWSAVEERDTRTGMCNFHNDAKYHRFRITVAAGSAWSHLHGLTPFYNESGFG